MQIRTIITQILQLVTTILLVIVGTATEFGGYTMLLVLPQRIEAGVITADIAIGIIQCATIHPVIACRGFIQQHFSAPIDPRPGIQRLVDKQVIGPAAVIHIGIGGIRGLMDQSAVSGSALDKWLGIAETARQAALTIFRKNPERDPYEVCEQTAILVSLNNLLSYPWLAEKVAQDEVQLDGWYFDMQSGSLVGYDSDQHQFVNLVPPLVCALK